MLIGLQSLVHDRNKHQSNSRHCTLSWSENTNSRTLHITNQQLGTKVRNIKSVHWFDTEHLKTTVLTSSRWVLKRMIWELETSCSNWLHITRTKAAFYLHYTNPCLLQAHFFLVSTKTPDDCKHEFVSHNIFTLLNSKIFEKMQGSRFRTVE